FVAFLDWNSTPPLDYHFSDCGASAENNGGISVIKVASSADGGSTWSETIVDHACAADVDNPGRPMVAAPQAAVSAAGDVYVSYEFMPQINPRQPNAIRFVRSVNHGETF